MHPGIWSFDHEIFPPKPHQCYNNIWPTKLSNQNAQVYDFSRNIKSIE